MTFSMSPVSVQLRPLQAQLLASLHDDFIRRVERNNTKHPVTNILQSPDGQTFYIEMALTGFAKSDLEIQYTPNVRLLEVKGKRQPRAHEKEAKYLQRQISMKDFQRKFELPEHFVVADSKLEDGLLTIELKLEIPVEAKPQMITIN